MDVALDWGQGPRIDVGGMAEPDASIVILQELHLHPEKVDVMYSLEIEADLVADLETVHLRVTGHELRFVSRLTELSMIELDLAIVSMLDLLRRWPYHGVEIAVLRSLRMVVCRLLSALLGKDLEARGIKGKVVLLSETAQAGDLKSGLHELNRLPVLMSRSPLELVDEFEL